MISIIVPVYKVESFLRQCVDSILAQTYRNLEILLINDGSPDKCGEISEEYASADNRVRVFHTENRGLSSARNLGLQEARGEYIGFVDSDDWVEPDMYEKLLRRIEESGTNISACGVLCEYQKTNYAYSISNGVFIGKEAIQALVCNLSNGAWNKLYKKKCWTGIRFPDNHLYEDVATIYKVLLKSDSLSCIQEPLYHYRMRKGSIVHSQTKDNLMDYWTAHYERYVLLSRLAEVKKNRIIMDHLEKQVVSAAVKTWIWTYLIPRKQRDYEFLHKVSVFVRTHFSILGKRNWGGQLRVGSFFTRYANSVSFGVLYVLYRINLSVHAPNRRKLFPST